MSKSRRQIKRERENKRAQETVQYGPQHWINGQTADALESHVKPMSGLGLRDLLKRIPGVAGGDRRSDD